MMTMNYSSNTRARRPLSDDNLRAIAPSIFATQPWGEVSSHYAFIPTSEVIRRLRAEGFVPVMAAQSRARLAGKSDFTRHMIRFQQPDYATDSRKVGDLIPEAVLVNSHDRTSSFELSAGLFRLVEEVAFSRIDIRLAHKLLGLSHGGDTIAASQEQLASELGTAREVVSRILLEFQRRGWVTLGRGHIAVTGRAGLETVAGEHR